MPSFMDYSLRTWPWKMNHIPKTLAVIAVVSLSLLVAGAVVLRGLDDYDLSEHRQQALAFETDGAELSGTLVLPADDPAAPILVVVHGDGAQDRFASGGYLPLMSALLDSGVGVYSWDKPGVGASTGDWLQQSMAERSVETLAAIRAVEAATAASGNALGVLGFSQAGWVLPEVATRVSADIPFILVGGATNWQAQSAYLTAVRLEAEGYAEEAIRTRVRRQAERDARLFAPPARYDRYLAQTTDEPPMSEARFHFVARNHFVDSTEELSKISAPTLAMFGEDDLNVDARREAQVFERALADGHPANEVVIWPDATHGLTKSRWFNYQQPSQLPWYSSLYAVLAGRDIYAPGVIDHMASWVLQNGQ